MVSRFVEFRINAEGVDNGEEFRALSLGIRPHVSVQVCDSSVSVFLV